MDEQIRMVLENQKMQLFHEHEAALYEKIAKYIENETKKLLNPWSEIMSLISSPKVRRNYQERINELHNLPQNMRTAADLALAARKAYDPQLPLLDRIHDLAHIGENTDTNGKPLFDPNLTTPAKEAAESHEKSTESASED